MKVSFPWFSESSESAWARCLTPSAGSDYGVYFLPDIKDEVAVAFEHGELDRPFVLGALWNGRAHPPQSNADRKNSRHVIKTKGRSTITFDDTPSSESVEIATQAGQKVKVSDAAGGSVRVSAGGCEIALEAKTGAVSIKGGAGGVTIQNGTLAAARTSDAVAPSATATAWMTAVSTAVSALPGAQLPPQPATAIGQISGGSGTVKIG